jgi:hypothetical protein
MYSGEIFANRFKIVNGSATLGAQLATATKLPASGSFVDVSGCERVHILARLGTVHTSDAPVLEPKCANAANGTPAAIDTAALSHTAANDDDTEWVTWTIEVRKLPAGYHYLLVDVTGGVTNGSYANVVFLLEERPFPVTQIAAVLPVASQHTYVG